MLVTMASYHMFMDNYFTFFCLFMHLRVNNIQATGEFNKNRLRNCTIIADKDLTSILLF